MRKSKFQIYWFIQKICIYTVYTAYIYVDGNPIYGLGQLVICVCVCMCVCVHVCMRV